MTMRRLMGLALLALAACENGGSERTLGISATGTVSGFIYFDANGSRSADVGDVPFAGVRVAILGAGVNDTVRVDTTGADGRFRVSGLPVGRYTVAIDTTAAGDSASVIGERTRSVTVAPDDSAVVEGIISFPIRSVNATATLPLGTRVFLTGIALHARETYSDTTLHLIDTSGAIQATRVRPTTVAVVAGDSIRVRGRVATRLGQRVLDDVSVFIVGPTFIPPIPTLTTAQANGAAAGVRNAELIRVANAQIIDSATVSGNLRLTVNDGSGALTVILDRQSDVAFRVPLPAGQYSAGIRYDIVGILAPTGTGTWQLRPRSSLDLFRR